MKPGVRLLQRAIRKLQRQDHISDECFLDESGAYSMVGALCSVAGCSDDLLRQAYPLEVLDYIPDGGVWQNKPFEFLSVGFTPRDMDAAITALEEVIGTEDIELFGGDHPKLVLPAMRQA